ncbi:MAG: hypothetical protein EOO99_05810 [Pedobacter sp.]|nr:MAG: hypothetical protein EOO99_05810 [Pedobacter sp.]
MEIKDYSDIDVLEAYLLGDLNAKDSYEVEKLCLQDPFVAQALEGLKQSKHLRYNLSLLQKQLQQKVVQKDNKKKWQITSHRLSIGSAAAVLFISVGILFWFKSSIPKSSQKGTQVVMSENKAKTMASNQSSASVLASSIFVLQGSIKDANTTQSIAAAKVEIEGSNLQTFSANDGTFNLTMEEVNYPLEVKVTAKGYQDFKVKLNSINDTQNWHLIPNP